MYESFSRHLLFSGTADIIHIYCNDLGRDILKINYTTMYVSTFTQRFRLRSVEQNLFSTGLNGLVEGEQVSSTQARAHMLSISAI